MRDIRNSRIKIIFVLAATALVLVYVYAIAPFFLEKVDSLIAENKQIEYDLNQIEEMGLDTKTISRNIASAKDQLSDFEKKAEVDGSNYDMNISEKADDSGVTINEMMVDEPKVSGQKNATGKVLYVQPLTVSFSGNFADGIQFIDTLENSETGIYKIQDFLYSKGSDDEEKSWMVSLEVYYYDEEPKE